MKETLIFGADISKFGAVGDGKTDCTKSFLDALSSKENLITVPYGEYIIKSSLKISSNTKLHIHPLAKLIFEDVTDSALISAGQAAKSIIIEGGTWICHDSEESANKSVFSFAGCENIRFVGCTLNPESRICAFLTDCTDIRTEKISVVSHNSAVSSFIFTDCSDVTLKSIKYRCSCPENSSGDGSLIDFNGKNSAFYISDIYSENAQRFIRSNNNSVLDDIRVCGLDGGFTKCGAEFCKNSKIEYALLQEIDIFCAKSHENCAYFKTDADISQLEIESFKRRVTSDAAPIIPTVMIQNQNGSSNLIIDGLAIDDVIGAKARSKLTSMYPARLANPHGRFIYTLEAGIGNGDSFILPQGGFDTLELSGK